MGPLALVALVPLFALIGGSRPRRGLALGVAFGLAFFGATMYWILMFGELAWSTLTIIEGSFVGLFGLLAPIVVRADRPWRNALALAALWTVIEWFRGAWPLGGFTWGQLGATQTGNPLLLPLASVAGVWGISFVVALVNGFLVAAWRRGRGGAGGFVWRRAIGPVAVGIAAAVAPAAIPLAEPDGGLLDVATIQLDVREAEAPDRITEDQAVARMAIGLHRTLAADPPDLVVWGESSLDPGAFDEPVWSEVRDAIGDLGVPTLAGGVPRDAQGRLRNQGILFDGTGTVVDRYTKVHLVPYGEYVPLKSLVGWLSVLDQIAYEITPGQRLEPLEVNGLRFANVICFENSFPALDRELVRQGVGFIVVTTNNSSYGFTAASRQHLAFSRLRAVEHGRWVVNAALSGISAIIDPRGRVVQRAELFETAVLRQTIRTSHATTLYTRLGDWVPWGSLILALGLFASAPGRRRDDREVPPLPARPRTLVILPTYDERETVERVIRGARAIGDHVEVLVVDDGSPDGTAEVVRALVAQDHRVGLIERPSKAGLASAYILGFRRALDEGHELVVEMDSDLSHDPEELPRLLEAARGAHLAIGSRYVPGGSVANWSRARVALSRAGNLYARLALGIPVRDATSGFRVYRRDLLAHLVATPITSDGYGFQIELALRSWLGGFRVTEAPITFLERRHGVSKISRRIVAEALWLVARWGLQLRLRGSAWPETKSR